MRVILVRLSALGDIVHTWPLAEALRAACSDLQLTWVVEAPLSPLVAGHPAVDEIIKVHTRRWRKQPFASKTRAEIRALKGRFRELRPDLCIDSQGVVKSAIIARWTGAPRRVGLARPWRRERLAGLAYTATMPGSSADRHVVATNLELVRTLDAEAQPELRAPSGSWFGEQCQSAAVDGDWSQPYAVLLPGAGHPSKVLPVPTLSTLADALVAMGMAVVIAWGPGERDRAAAVVAASGNGVHLPPATDLRQLGHLLAAAQLVVGGDTGPIHLAASLGVATVGVFLTTSSTRNGPLGPQVRIVSAVAEDNGQPTGSAWARSVRKVSVNEIMAAINTIS